MVGGQNTRVEKKNVCEESVELFNVITLSYCAVVNVWVLKFTDNCKDFCFPETPKCNKKLTRLLFCIVQQTERVHTNLCCKKYNRLDFKTTPIGGGKFQCGRSILGMCSLEPNTKPHMFVLLLPSRVVFNCAIRESSPTKQKEKRSKTIIKKKQMQ